MIEFLTTGEISGIITKILREAKREICLVSPYLKLSADVVQRLEEADRKNVSIKIIYGKTELEESVETALSRLKGLDLYFYEHLHAKCYFNENRLVITSMNLYEYSQHNNREMGVHATSDENVYRSAKAETEGIIRISTPKSLRRSFVRSAVSQMFSRSESQKDDTGYCIRCKEKIKQDASAPFCRGCYASWARWKDETYTEKHCHGCGRSERTSKARPLCRSCYRKFAA